MSNPAEIRALVALAECEAERDRARSVAVALEQECARIDTAIRELHRAGGMGFCITCRALASPCPTIRALDGTP